MKNFINVVKHFVTSEDGPTAVEYAVVVALIIIAAMGAVTFFGEQLTDWFTGTGATVQTLPTS